MIRGPKGALISMPEAYASHHLQHERTAEYVSDQHFTKPEALKNISSQMFSNTLEFRETEHDLKKYSFKLRENGSQERVGRTFTPSGPKDK